MERKIRQRSFVLGVVLELRLLQTLVRSARTLNCSLISPGGMSRRRICWAKFQVHELKRILEATIHSIPAVKKLALSSVNLAIPKFRNRISRMKQRLMHKAILALQKGLCLLLNTVVTSTKPSGAHSGS